MSPPPEVLDRVPWRGRGIEGQVQKKILIGTKFRAYMPLLACFAQMNVVIWVTGVVAQNALKLT